MRDLPGYARGKSMATVDVEDVPLTGPKAHRLADMAGIHMDLNWTVEACARLIQGSQQPQPDIVTDAIHDAALIRYGRCFRGGKRNAFQIPNDWLPARLKQTHDSTICA